MTESLTLQMIADLEDIKIIKAQYCRFLDQKRFDDLENIFEPDCRFIIDGDEAKHLEKRFAPDKIGTLGPWMELVRSICVGSTTTVHHVHSPEITLHDENSASGIWAMEDYVVTPITQFRGYGHYAESYRKGAAGWKIASWRLDRIRIDLI